jgi:hypothetical protein
LLLGVAVEEAAIQLHPGNRVLCVAHQLVTSQPAFPPDLAVQHRKEAVNKDCIKSGIFNLLLRKYMRIPIRYLLLLRNPPAEFGLGERGQRRSHPRESIGLEHCAFDSSRLQTGMGEVTQIKDRVMGDELLP